MRGLRSKCRSTRPIRTMRRDWRRSCARDGIARCSKIVRFPSSAGLAGRASPARRHDNPIVEPYPRCAQDLRYAKAVFWRRCRQAARMGRIQRRNMSLKYSSVAFVTTSGGLRPHCRYNTASSIAQRECWAVLRAACYRASGRTNGSKLDRRSIKPPKPRQARRIISLPVGFVETMPAHRRCQAEQRLLLGLRRPSAEDYVFTLADRSPYRGQAISGLGKCGALPLAPASHVPCPALLPRIYADRGRARRGNGQSTPQPRFPGDHVDGLRSQVRE